MYIGTKSDSSTEITNWIFLKMKLTVCLSWQSPRVAFQKMSTPAPPCALCPVPNCALTIISCLLSSFFVDSDPLFLSCTLKADGRTLLSKIVTTVEVADYVNTLFLFEHFPNFNFGHPNVSKLKSFVAIGTSLHLHTGAKKPPSHLKQKHEEKSESTSCNIQWF